MTHPGGAARGANVVWDWSGALLGAVYALPAAAVIGEDLGRGLALAVGVLPAAATGLAPTRRARRMTAVVGALIGLSMFVGAVIGQVPLVAVGGIVALAVGAAWLAGRSRLGTVAVTLCVPLVGVGLSYHTDVGKAAGIAVLMAVGSIYGWLVSLLWPERPPQPPPGQPPVTLWYGLRLGLAGATAAAVGFALDLGHVGWATAAAMLVMRPSEDMQRLRSVGRVLSVTAGALAGILVVRAEPPTAVYGLVVIADLAAAAATHRSRWYVTSAFTTFLVFLLLLFGDPTQAQHRFNERVIETALGVAVAYAFGLLIPTLWRRRRPTPAAAA